MNQQENSSEVEKRIAQDKDMLLEELRAIPIVEIACSKTKIGRSTYYRYRQSDPKFAEDADKAIRDGSLLMNDVAETYLIGAIKSKNMSAITLWLKTHHPSYAAKLEMTGTFQQIREDLTPEQQKVVEDALRLASIVTKENIKKLN